jgi:hypothetical protein
MQRFRLRKGTAGKLSEITVTHASSEYISGTINLDTAAKELLSREIRRNTSRRYTVEQNDYENRGPVTYERYSALWAKRTSSQNAS